MKPQIFFAVGIAITIFTSAIFRSLTVYRIERDAPVYNIRAGEFLPILAILVGAFFAVSGAAGFFKSSETVYLLFLIVGVMVITLFLPFIVRSEVRIFDETIVGPNMIFGPFLWYPRTTIRIADLRIVGITQFGYSYYETRDSNRIYFSKSYRDYQAFARTLNMQLGSREPLSEQFVWNDSRQRLATMIGYKAGRLVARLFALVARKK